MIYHILHEIIMLLLVAVGSGYAVLLAVALLDYFTGE